MTPWSLGLAIDMLTWVGRSLGTLLRHHAADTWVAVGVVCVVDTYNGLVGSLGTLRRYHARGARDFRGQVWAG